MIISPIPHFMEFSLTNWMGGRWVKRNKVLCMIHLTTFIALTLTPCYAIQQFSLFYIPFFET